MDTDFIVKIVIGVGLLLAYVVVVSVKGYLVRRYARGKHIEAERTALINKLITVFLFIGLVVAEAITWGVHLSGLYVFVTSFFAMVAIGFFAVWSVLSNITSSVLIFFLFPYKIGDYIQVIGDDISGRITDITLFHLIVESKDKSVVTIPNNLVIQKSIRILGEGEPVTSV
ncbi:MAG: mechanosensitive ion channel family protein [Candidatus Latescibacterota bacterium]|nr:MAG: mechanosensitive ion channel family protein [Candidatus Latescibacterota bacterium]